MMKTTVSSLTAADATCLNREPMPSCAPSPHQK
jgi:hypothetical protein